jgi:hypothetical protein
MRLITKVERALGDLVNEAPFLNVDEYDLSEVSISMQGEVVQPGSALMCRAIDVLRASGFTFDTCDKYGEIFELIVTGAER